MDKTEKQFVSRAGQKLDKALEEFKIDVNGKICADLGCSTGGFTDCLLQRGAEKVYAVDTGYGVLEWGLRNNPKVVVLERKNALYIELPELVDFISIDVGWTSQKLIIPKALQLLKNDGVIVSLLKPHYEADNSWLKKGTLQEEYIQKTIEKVEKELNDLNIEIQDRVESPIIGTKGGNKEFLILINK